MISTQLTDTRIIKLSFLCIKILGKSTSQVLFNPLFLHCRMMLKASKLGNNSYGVICSKYNSVSRATCFIF